MSVYVQEQITKHKCSLRLENDILHLKQKYELLSKDWDSVNSGRARVYRSCAQDMQHLLDSIRQ